MRMLNKLFTLEKNRTDSNDTLPSGKSKTNRGSSGREKKNSRRNKSNRGDDDDDVGRRGGRIQVSQVKLLAEHCYSIGDDKIEEVGIIFSIFFFFQVNDPKILSWSQQKYQRIQDGSPIRSSKIKLIVVMNSSEVYKMVLVPSIRNEFAFNGPVKISNCIIKTSFKN